MSQKQAMQSVAFMNGNAAYSGTINNTILGDGLAGDTINLHYAPDQNIVR